MRYLPSTTKHSGGPEAIGVVDIGTNTLRLLIGHAHKGRVTRIFSARAVTRLGERLLQTGNLNSNNIQLSVTSLGSFKDICDNHGIQRIIAVGTSALRDAGNSHLFIQQVKKVVGFDIDIIPGEREAYLTLLGTKRLYETCRVGWRGVACCGSGSDIVGPTWSSWDLGRAALSD